CSASHIRLRRRMRYPRRPKLDAATGRPPMRRRLYTMLGIEIPIIQAPMGGAVPARLAAEVSNAGGLGTLPLWRADRDALRATIRKTRSLTAKPFAVNLNLEFPQDERLEVCLEEGVPVI